MNTLLPQTRALELLYQVEQDPNALWSLLETEPDAVVQALAELAREVGCEPQAQKLDIYLNLRVHCRAA